MSSGAGQATRVFGSAGQIALGRVRAQVSAHLEAGDCARVRIHWNLEQISGARVAGGKVA